MCLLWIEIIDSSIWREEIQEDSDPTTWQHPTHFFRIRGTKRGPFSAGQPILLSIIHLRYPFLCCWIPPAFGASSFLLRAFTNLEVEDEDEDGPLTIGEGHDDNNQPCRLLQRRKIHGRRWLRDASRVSNSMLVILAMRIDNHITHHRSFSTIIIYYFSPFFRWHWGYGGMAHGIYQNPTTTPIESQGYITTLQRHDIVIILLRPHHWIHQPLPWIGTNPCRLHPESWYSIWSKCNNQRYVER